MYSAGAKTIHLTFCVPWTHFMRSLCVQAKTIIHYDGLRSLSCLAIHKFLIMLDYDEQQTVKTKMNVEEF